MLSQAILNPGLQKKNEVLLSEGEICKFNVFVSTGCHRLYTINIDGQGLKRYIYPAFISPFYYHLPTISAQARHSPSPI